MISAEDLFTEEPDLEIIEENDEIDPEENEIEIENNEETSQPAEPVKTKKIVRNPQPKLNEETLKGPKGISALPCYFDKIKFKGSGHEEEDLGVILKTYEYWCHRLFPKFPFDSCIARIEKLGTKRAVQTHVKKIRMDLLFEENPINSEDEENDENSAMPVEINQEINDSIPNDLFSSIQSTENQFEPNSEPEITEEQQERMRLNRERAEKLRLERLKKIQEKAQSSLALED